MGRQSPAAAGTWRRDVTLAAHGWEYCHKQSVHRDRTCRRECGKEGSSLPARGGMLNRRSANGAPCRPVTVSAGSDLKNAWCRWSPSCSPFRCPKWPGGQVFLRSLLVVAVALLLAGLGIGLDDRGARRVAERVLTGANTSSQLDPASSSWRLIRPSFESGGTGALPRLAAGRQVTSDLTGGSLAEGEFASSSSE